MAGSVWGGDLGQTHAGSWRSALSLHSTCTKQLLLHSSPPRRCLPLLCSQCVGRGLRPHAGKAECVVIDLTDRHHDFATVASLGMVYPNEEWEGMGGGWMGGQPPPPGPKEAKGEAADWLRFAPCAMTN